MTDTQQQAMDEEQMAMDEKVRENRLRRAAERQGLKLVKSRRRDPRAHDYGVYWVQDAFTSGLLTNGMGIDLDSVEEFLLGEGGEIATERPGPHH